MLKKAALGLFGAGIVLMSAPAFAGEWKLNPRACPDLVEDRYDRREDRRDARVDTGRRDRMEDRFDRRENRRDRAVTICPARAFYYQPSRRELRHQGRGRHHGWRNANARPPLKWDRRMRMSYRYVGRRKIYVRG
ncbi:hypothetical protein [Hyphococcus luteus]|uniref:Uncharacterized protein n=1 Tax=Hyphococcus luteus TaxID=2058213 RepID=A0A2S7K6C2_9PROT|nr:hypothetical protein [Marinicaulis flavus]PQA88065.1 hypothetical protein CW354_06980 [Marinicaulis flavus]